MFFIAHVEVTIILPSPEVLIITVGSMLMEIIAGLLSRAVLEGDSTQRTVWKQTILTER